MMLGAKVEKILNTITLSLNKSFWLSKVIGFEPLFLYTYMSNDILSVGILLYGLHYFLIILVGLVLLISMVCAIVLSLNGLKKL